MNELLQAFVLGNSAILTNVCMLPLYPGLIAFLAGNAGNERTQRATKWLGFLVLAGVLTMMLAVGWLLYTFQQSFGAILPILLPSIYIVVFVLGLLMLSGRNPFARLGTTKIPVLRNPYAAAFLYGLLLGPMTLALRRTAGHQRLSARRQQFGSTGQQSDVLSLLRPRLRLAAGCAAARGPALPTQLHRVDDAQPHGADTCVRRTSRVDRRLRLRD